MNMVKRDELMRRKKRRLDSFRNMTRSLEAALRDRRCDEIDESTSMAAVGLVLAVTEPLSTLVATRR
jgi:hypothetical protein